MDKVPYWDVQPESEVYRRIHLAQSWSAYWLRVFDLPMSKPRLTPQMVEVATRYLTEMVEGKVCPVCHAPLTKRYQQGKCVYGLPCGHRLYVGRLSKEERKGKR